MNDFDMGTGLSAIREIVSLSDIVVDGLRDNAFDPHNQKQLTRRYTITQAGELVGRTPAAIRKAEDDGLLPEPEKDHRNRRLGYSLADVNRMRRHFNTWPWRQPDEEPLVLSVQNFKGGVGKSTVCAHLSQYLAEKGYRVLVIDCDSQASTTATFGFRPDFDIGSDETLLPYFDTSSTDDPQEDLEYAIRQTYWDGLHLIPSNLSLYTSEYLLAAKAGRTGIAWLDRLKNGIRTISHSYDVVIMDPPPALGLISLNVLRAANALVIPTPPAMYDYHSTVTFFRMLENILETIEKSIGEPVNYKFLRILISKYDDKKSAQSFVTRIMSKHYAQYLLGAALKSSAEIDNAAVDWKTVFELEKPTTSKRVHERAVATLRSVCESIEFAIRASWPSHRAALEDEGRLVT